jgi:hypothetical protein
MDELCAHAILICDNFLYRLQGHAFGAPGRPALVRLVQWERAALGGMR